MSQTTEEEPAGGLTGLDWLVIVAATAALIVSVLWLVQGPPSLPIRPPAEPAEPAGT